MPTDPGRRLATRRDPASGGARRAACILLVALGCVGVAACSGGGGHDGPQQADQRILGADPAIGRATIVARGCSACHRIPGLPGPHGNVGPSLADLKGRVYLPAGLANRPDNLVAWLMDPPAIDPSTAMPDLGIGTDEAKHIAAYLYAVD